MTNVIEARSSHVILKMKFSMPKPPNYMRGQDRIDYLEERAWVSNDFVDYAGRQGKYSDKETPQSERFVIAPDKGNYLEYVSRQGTFSGKGKKGDSPKGTGVWGKDGPLEGAELERVKKVFQNTGGNIWHGIISPTKEFGDSMLDTKEKAIEFTQSCFTRFVASTHLRYDNVEWFCGWHDDSESGIKHIQFAFCEKDKHINAKGELSYTQKGLIKQSALADALVSFEEYFSGHAQDVHIARDVFFKTFKQLSPRDVKVELATDLLQLAKDLPKVKGRAGYRSKEFEPFRERIDNLADKMIKYIPELNKNYINLMDKVAERETRFGDTAKQFSKMQPSDKIARLRQDIRERIGNSIISFAKRLDYNERQKDYEALKEQKLSMMAQARAEKFLRQQQKSERRSDLKRFNRLFSRFYASTSGKDYLDEFYKDIEKYKKDNVVNDSGDDENH